MIVSWRCIEAAKGPRILGDEHEVTLDNAGCRKAKERERTDYRRTLVIRRLPEAGGVTASLARSLREATRGHSEALLMARGVADRERRGFSEPRGS